VQKLTLTVPEAAELLGIGRTAAYEAARTGELPTVRLGRRVLVPREALARFLTPTPAGGGISGPLGQAAPQ
jgi:excisionase family DNA binding protein